MAFDTHGNSLPQNAAAAPNSSAFDFRLRWRKTVAALLLIACGTLASPAPAKDIVLTAIDAGQFTLFLEAIKQAGLESRLRAPGPFTIFAWTDAAFRSLPPDIAKQLLEPANRHMLAKLLNFHIVEGRLSTADIVGKTVDLKTLNGQSLTVQGRYGLVLVNGGWVTEDIHADIGLIQVINTVLLPQTPLQPSLDPTRTGR